MSTVVLLILIQTKERRTDLGCVCRGQHTRREEVDHMGPPYGADRSPSKAQERPGLVIPTDESRSQRQQSAPGMEESS